MKRIFRQESLIADGRFFWASVAIVALTSGLILRLWFIQIYRGDHYRLIAEKNRIRKIEIPAPRGMIYDRYGQLVLGNRPFFDLVLVPQYVKDRDMTFNVLSRLLHVPASQFDRRIKAVAGRPKFLPVNLKRNLSLHEVSTIEANRVFLPGVEVAMAPRREYKPNTPAHMVGYLGEIDQNSLKELNVDSDNPYILGDLIGKQGLEARWEKFLRGRRGYSLIQVDAFGRQSDLFADQQWQLPKVAAVPGADLELTIDLELQKATVDAFRGKNGAVVVINPMNGEILAMLSEPGYDPTIYQDGLSPEVWRSLTSHPFTPLLDKTTGGEFAPGSVYKAVVAIAALQEKLISTSSTHVCTGSFQLGNRTFGCHERGGHGVVDLKKALMKSCDVYFYQVGVELGVDKIAAYARKLGLGSKLGVQLNMERPGLVPTADWKQIVFKTPWSVGDTPNISIGQGFNLVTPIQMANLYATIANGGKVWRPFLVKRIVNQLGETLMTQNEELISEATDINPKNLAIVREMLREVVMNPDGTGKNAQVPDHTVSGKTGSVQVVSLKRNNNKNTDVSMKWKEHAMFAAFSPTEDAEIAVAIISEHDRVGGGGASAAPVAGHILRAYWQLKEQRAKGLATNVLSPKKEAKQNDVQQ